MFIGGRYELTFFVENSLSSYNSIEVCTMLIHPFEHKETRHQGKFEPPNLQFK